MADPTQQTEAPRYEATDKWVRLDGAGHLRELNLVPDPTSEVMLSYDRYRELLIQSGWEQVYDWTADPAATAAATPRATGPQYPESPVLPEPTPELRERFVRRHGGDTSVLGFTDDEDGNEKDECTLPMPTLRELLMDAGYERDYVRDDVELDRVHRKGAAESDVAQKRDVDTEGVKSRPFPGWDEATVDEVRDIAHRSSPPFLPLAEPLTPRGVLLRQLRDRIRAGHELMASTSDLLGELTNAQSERTELETSVIELVGAIAVLDNVGR